MIGLAKTVENLQLGALAKSCIIAFLPQALILFILPQDILYELRFYVLAVNILVSLVLGWRLYKQRQHLVFTYDESRFTLRKGAKEMAAHNWSEFRKVSLARSEHGEFFVRLYRDKDDFFAIPVSKLKLDPFAYRFDVMKLVASAR